jgi:hypothetical protein
MEQCTAGPDVAFSVSFPTVPKQAYFELSRRFASRHKHLGDGLVSAWGQQPKVSGIGGAVNSTFVALRCLDFDVLDKLVRLATGTARRDGSRKQLGAQAAAGKVSADRFSNLASDGAGIEKNYDRRTGAT